MIKSETYRGVTPVDKSDDMKLKDMKTSKLGS